MEEKIARYFEVDSKTEWDWGNITSEFMATLDYSQKVELLDAMVGRIGDLGVKYRRQCQKTADMKAEIMILREQRVTLDKLLRHQYG